MVELRPIKPSERDDFTDVAVGAFGDRRDPWHDRWFHQRVAPEMTIAAFEKGAIVGTSAAIPMTLSIPGHSCAAAGITAAGVLPTHRRRGLLRAMMDAHLRQARAAGTSLAILWASEGSIYGRFGFGPATGRLRVCFETPGMALRDESVSGPLRLVDQEEALQLMPLVYDRAAATRPGLVLRERLSWDSLTADDDPHLPANEAHHFFVVHGEAPDGYAIYRVRPRWSPTGSRATVVLTELVADGPGPAADLWRFLLSLDLVTRVEARQRPVDEPLLWMARDPQAIEVLSGTGIWARILNVPQALGERLYQQDGELVLEVSDPFLPEVGGRFLLQVRAGVGTCSPSENPVDLRLGISELSCGYLGQLCFGAMARAGRVQEASPGASMRADQLLSWDPPPWCLDDF
ncbi:MAG TPA: GNAT family N-acetyltransferase [Candidatus Dormibacteraeota bacterium]|nr:GNAT family N-acetyltransferase [Candidatus Dormibacteraeota bacterium]